MKFSDLLAYFEAAAVSNKVLKHNPATNKTFLQMDIEEMMASSRTDWNDIMMVLEGFEKRLYDALSDNKRKPITLAFLIIKPIDVNDYTARIAGFDVTEAVSEQILTKIINDVKKRQQNPNHQWALKGFDPNTVRQQMVTNLFSNWCGWRTELTLNQTWKNNLLLKNEDWLNDTAA